MTPVVSVGLPVAQEDLAIIRDAIQSVLNQTFTDWELVIVADGSPQSTIDYLTSVTDKRVHVHVRKASRGLGARLNEIADLATGVFLARMDADDVMFPMRLEHQTGLLLKDLDVDVISSRAVIIDDDGQVLGITPPTSSNVSIESMLAATPFVHPTVMARTEWWRTHRYDPTFLRSQDKALWITAAAVSRYRRDQEACLFYRVARQLDPEKYRRTAHYERQIVRRYGPEIVGIAGTIRITTSSLAKQLAVSTLARLQLGALVLNRRYLPLANDASDEYSSLLRQATDPDPQTKYRSIDYQGEKS